MSHTLLIIDDEVATRERLTAFLEASGYRVVCADSGEQGLARYAETHPDLVLLDLKMSNGDGPSVLEAFSSNEHNTPVIVMSSEGVMSDVVESLRYGAADYLFKPIKDLEVLHHSVERCLEQGDLQRENLLYRQQLEEANRGLKESFTLLEQDQLAGRAVQMKMLPPNPKSIGGYRFSHQMFPSFYLSGDFVDYFLVGRYRAVFFIADVSGHGASSAFVTVLLKNLFARKRSDFVHRHDDSIVDPAAMLQLANGDLLGTCIGKYATMCVGVIDLRSNKLTYSVAGHLPQPLLIEEGGCHYLEGKGPPVGLFPEVEYESIVRKLPEKFALALFSDGILEVLPADGVLAKEDILRDTLGMQKLPCTIDDVTRMLDLDDVQDAPDDIAVLMISRESENGAG